MTRWLTVAMLSVAALAGSQRAAQSQGLIDNVFTNSYSGWVDAYPDRGGDWRLSLHTPTLIETNGSFPAPDGAEANSGVYEPVVLVQDDFMAPASYNLNATLRTNDDDLLGLVFNYQDADNYFRVGMRQQSGGSFGGTEGLSVQKVVGGVVTQISPATAIAGPAAVDQAMIDNRTPFDVQVAVDGSNYEVFFNGTSLASGTDSDLAAGGKIGFQSWAQQADSSAVTPFWGTEVDQVSVTQGGDTLYSETFDRRSTAWRPLVMTNAAGVSTLTTASREDQGNFGVAVNAPWIYQQSNGFEYATVDNVDFIGPAVVVDEPGSESMTDYRMQTRIGSTDNDGLGLLVRVEDDDNFYRVTFANEATGGDATRAPMGMSVQKVRNGAWSQLYRDDDAPLFVYTPGAGGSTPADADFPGFDVSVAVVGNQLTVQVIDEVGNVIDYPVITDDDDPILAGTVGLHTWGANNTYFTNFGGQPGPLVTAIPEPTCLALFGVVIGGALLRRRQQRPNRRRRRQPA